jgi:hypothetical protein
LLCVVAPVLYGIVHDQFTAHICGLSLGVSPFRADLAFVFAFASGDKL